MDDVMKFKTWCLTCGGATTHDLCGFDEQGRPVWKCWLCLSVTWRERLVPWPTKTTTPYEGTMQ